MAATQQNTEIQLTQVSLIVTAVASTLLIWSTGAVAWNALTEGRILGLLEAMFFGVLAGFLVYGNLCYQMARIGQLKRTNSHRASWLNWSASTDQYVPFDNT